jgi:GNAT superfamily N-acetyltransferase
MGDDVSITTSTDIAEADAGIVRNTLRRYNAPVAGDDGHRLLNVVARDAGGTVIGGLLGGTYWGWLHIDILCVDERYRGLRIGSRLLDAAEAEARRRGCLHAHLDTFEFQAPGFYEKHHYVRFGELDDLPPGHRRIFMRKDL